MKPGPYPVPSKHRWSVAVEFHDGTRIEGTSDDDVLERWRQVAVWGAPTPPSPTVFRRLVADRALVLTGQTVDRRLAADLLLDALAGAGALAVIRR